MKDVVQNVATYLSSTADINNLHNLLSKTNKIWNLFSKDTNLRKDYQLSSLFVEWEKDQIEDSGLLKIDLLGNRSLAVVRDTIKRINLQSSADKIPYINYHEIQPLEDSKTREIMRAGKTMGVFYIESPSVRQLMAKAKVVDFEHIVIFSSIIRPAANRFTNLMLDRIHGQKPTTTSSSNLFKSIKSKTLKKSH